MDGARPVVRPPTRAEGSGAPREPLWSGLFVLLTFASFLTSTSNQAATNLIPLSVDRLGGPPAFSGILVLVFSLAAILGRIVAGQLVDRRGRRWTLIAGSLAFFAGVAGPVLLPSVELLLLWRVWQGLGFAAVTTAAATMVADTLPRSRMSEGISYFGLGQSLSSAVGPSIGILLLGLGSISQAFAVVAVAVVVVVLIALSAKSPWDERRRGERAEGGAAPTGDRPARAFWRVFERTALPVFLVQFVASLGFSQYLNFLTLYGLRSGFDRPGLFFTVAAIAMIVSRLGAARHLRRFSTAVLFPVIFGLGAASFAVVATASDEVVFISAGLLFGFAFGTFMPVMSVITVSLAPQSRWGAANAMNYLGGDIGIGLGGVLAGALIMAIPFSSLFWIGAALMVCACALALALIPRHALRGDQPSAG